MATDPTWPMELALWTLNHMLPFAYRRSDPTAILNCAADYIIFLKSNIWKLEQEVDLNITNNLTDAEEEFLLEELGLNSDSQVLHKMDVDWVASAIKTSSKENEETKPTIGKIMAVKVNEEESVERKEDKKKANDLITSMIGPGGKKRVKRPSNGFIRFSSDKRKEIAMIYPKCDNREVSRFLGLLWHQLSPEEKRPYMQQFEEEMTKIRKEHPDWNYAGSRSQSAVESSLRTMTNVIQTQRLRPRRNNLQVVVDNLVMKPKKPKIRKQSKTQQELWVMCDLCYQWRKMPQMTDSTTLPETWDCTQNPDLMFNNCDIPEEVHI